MSEQEYTDLSRRGHKNGEVFGDSFKGLEEYILASEEDIEIIYSYIDHDKSKIYNFKVGIDMQDNPNRLFWEEQ